MTGYESLPQGGIWSNGGSNVYAAHVQGDLTINETGPGCTVQSTKIDGDLIVHKYGWVIPVGRRARMRVAWKVLTGEAAQFAPWVTLVGNWVGGEVKVKQHDHL